MVKEQGWGQGQEPGPDGGHGDAVAYVLGALDSAGRERFEAHAATCAECLRETDELRPLADHLALAVPQVDPPPELRERVLAGARAMLPVISAPSSTASPLQPRGAQEAPQGHPAGAPAAAAATMAVTREERRRPSWDVSGWGQRVAAPLAAASFLVALFSAGYAVSARQELHRTSASAAQLEETLSIMYQPGRVGRELSGDNAPMAKGMLYLVPEGLEAVLVTYNLPKLARQEVYQLWLNNPDSAQRISGGTFKVDEQGYGRLLVRARVAVSRFSTCGVTKEPEQGSQWPTGPRVLYGQL